MKQYHVLETLLHEIGHTYAKYKYIDERFQEYHHSFEELKADIFALHHIPRLVEFNIIPKNEEKIVFEAALSDFLGRLHLSLHIEQRKHHGFSAKVIYNILIEHQALLKRENKFILDYPKAQKVIANYFIFLQKFLFDAENKEIANYIETMNSSVITKNLINHLKLFKSDFYTHQNS